MTVSRPLHNGLMTPVEGFSRIGQGSRDVTLSPEPATSEPESISSASSASIGSSEMDPPGNVGG